MYNIQSQDKVLESGPHKGKRVSASSGYSSSWASKTDFDWDKIGVENCDVDLADSNSKCNDNTEHRAGSIRRSFKDWLDKVTGLEMEFSTENTVEAMTPEEIDVYLLNATGRYTLRVASKGPSATERLCVHVLSVDANPDSQVQRTEFCARWIRFRPKV